jgi:hypothetical protein
MRENENDPAAPGWREAMPITNEPPSIVRVGVAWSDNTPLDGPRGHAVETWRDAIPASYRRLSRRCFMLAGACVGVGLWRMFADEYPHPAMTFALVVAGLALLAILLYVRDVRREQDQGLPS